MFLEEDPEALGRAVEYHINIVIAGLPWIMQQISRMPLKQLSGTVTQSIKGCAQWSAPLLVPSFTPGIAAAITPPSLHTVGTAPGGVLNDLHLVRWREFFQELAVVRKPHVRLRLDGMQ